MTICFICDTAYQLLNCINFVYHLYTGKNNTIDIYIGRQFSESDNITSRLKEEHLFSNIYTYITYGNNYGNLRKIGRAIGILFPEKRIKAMLDSEGAVWKECYDTIFMSMPTHFSVAMAQCNPQAEIIYYDDGIGSYSGNIAEAMDRFNKLMYQLFAKSMKFMYPSELYVNNKELCRSIVAPVIKQLPQMQYASKDFWNLLKRVFSYENDEVYARYHVVYLMQPNDAAIPKIDKLNSEIEGVLSKERCVARPHPRQGNIEISGMCMDYSRSMWELLCAEKISDNHVLVSMCSTAQLMPKMLFGKEPYLIFTYQLFKEELPEKTYGKIEEVVKSIRSEYVDSRKICVPKDLEEFKQCLEIGEMQVEEC